MSPRLTWNLQCSIVWVTMTFVSCDLYFYSAKITDIRHHYWFICAEDQTLDMVHARQTCCKVSHILRLICFHN